jgi:deazaflavin-dependent oxidoreductase (nitroreductase family)
MSVQITPSGTRGGKMPRLPGPLMGWLNDLMFRLFRNRRFYGSRVLALSTVGARSGQPRRSTVAAFPEGDNAWLVVGSAGGAASHPAWVYNLARHPDQAWIDFGHRHLRVTPTSLSGAERAAAWQRITTESPGFKSYEQKTDREIPVIRLTAA